MNYNITDISNKTNIPINKISNVFLVGSHIYKTNEQGSDYDFIVIADTNINNREIRNGKLNIHIYNKEHFQEKLSNMKMIFIEAFLSPNTLLNNHKFYFNLNKHILIENTIKNSNETYTTFIKIHQSNPYLSLKKLYHSLRILIFTKDLLIDNKICFSKDNHILPMIRNDFYISKDITNKYNKQRIGMIDNLLKIYEEL